VISTNSLVVVVIPPFERVHENERAAKLPSCEALHRRGVGNDAQPETPSCEGVVFENAEGYLDSSAFAGGELNCTGALPIRNERCP
jgi:hypothetical protein